MAAVTRSRRDDAGRACGRADHRTHDHRSQTAPGCRGSRRGAFEQPADVFVVFGITGDLAKVMTLHSLYRLEARGLLTLPDRRRRRRRLDGRRPARARPRGDRRLRRAARPGGLRPVRRPALLPVRRLRRPRHVRAPRGRAQGRPQPGLLPGDPAVPLRRGGEGPRRRRAHRERARGRREAVRPRPRVRARARRGDARAPRRAPALPDRPLPREARASPRSSTCASRTRCSSRSGTATTSRACRSRWPRASASRTAGTSTTRSARCATSSSTT